MAAIINETDWIELLFRTKLQIELTVAIKVVAGLHPTVHTQPVRYTPGSLGGMAPQGAHQHYAEPDA